MVRQIEERDRAVGYRVGKVRAEIGKAEKVGTADLSFSNPSFLDR